MTDDKRYIAGLDSDARKARTRVAFITRRTSAQVRATDEQWMMTHPGVLIRVLIAIQLLTIVLVWIALLFNAPLEQLADPMHTPNPAKAPWYFLGLQELLHYFPPVVAGVIIPGLVVLALIVIPYFDINIHGDGLFLHDRAKRVKIFAGVVIVLCGFFAAFEVWVALVPTLVVAAFVAAAAYQASTSRTRGLAAKPLSFWIMTWFLTELIVLTAIGTFFRGPGWSWVPPWRGY
jgi:quinol-cytochrome oxidoreductase complex cytochrome b subunit